MRSFLVTISKGINKFSLYYSLLKNEYINKTEGIIIYFFNTIQV
jgi:hypothetical protein